MKNEDNFRVSSFLGRTISALSWCNQNFDDETTYTRNEDNFRVSSFLCRTIPGNKEHLNSNIRQYIQYSCIQIRSQPGLAITDFHYPCTILTKQWALVVVWKKCVTRCLRLPRKGRQTVGIIGGTGFSSPDIIENQVRTEVVTPFGAPSDAIVEGTIGGVPCAFIARHGAKHSHQPSSVNYRANIWALKMAGCTNVIASTATGSLREEYKPGDLVILSDFIDRTWGREVTFHDGESGPRGVCHLPMSPAFCERGRRALAAAARGRGSAVHETGVIVVIQGPRFSSKAESLMFRQWGGQLINMTTCPEVSLAKEAGLSYCSLALVTDYDCWRENERSVSVDEVFATFNNNLPKAVEVIIDAIQVLAEEDDLSYLDELQNLVKSSVINKR